jgi:hypothetical protein
MASCCAKGILLSLELQRIMATSYWVKMVTAHAGEYGPQEELPELDDDDEVEASS